MILLIEYVKSHKKTTTTLRGSGFINEIPVFTGIDYPNVTRLKPVIATSP
jgi:hypothetical protein